MKDAAFVYLFFSLESADVLWTAFWRSLHRGTEVVVDVVVRDWQVGDEVKQLFASHCRHAVPSAEVAIHIDAVLA